METSEIFDQTLSQHSLDIGRGTMWSHQGALHSYGEICTESVFILEIKICTCAISSLSLLYWMQKTGLIMYL